MSIKEKIRILLDGYCDDTKYVCPFVTIQDNAIERYSFSSQEIVAYIAYKEGLDPDSLDPSFANIVKNVLYDMQREGEIVNLSNTHRVKISDDWRWALKEYAEFESGKKYRSIDDE